MNTLRNQGYDDWIQDQLDADQSAVHEVARVIAVHKDSYIITRGGADVFAEGSGNLLYTTRTLADLPTTGDWVYADFSEDEAYATVHGVIPRKTVLKRKKAGKRADFQLIAANVDVAFIFQSLDLNFNLRGLERYIVMVNESQITPVILLSKCDLISQDQLDIILKDILQISPTTLVLPFSNLSGQNVDFIKNSLIPRKTYCLLGSSGVGKTTLLNSLIGSEKYETQPVDEKDHKGKHTTTSRSLIRLANGALLIDTPGMRELGNLSVDVGIEETFSEIVELIQDCKFNNCSHTCEKGCAILAAIKNGELNEQHYKNYLKLKSESEFHEMPSFKKREKDKAFGKKVKSVLKNKKGDRIN